MPSSNLHHALLRRAFFHARRRRAQYPVPGKHAAQEATTSSQLVMALSRQDIVVACLAVFFAWTTLVHWVPYLQLVSFVFVAGFTSAVAGFVYLAFTTSRGSQRTPECPPPPPTSLHFTSSNTWKAELEALKDRSVYNKPVLYDNSDDVSLRLGNLIDYILRDFVKTWYIKISPGSTFTNEVDRTIRLAVRDIVTRVVETDFVEFLVIRIIPILNGHFKAFAEAERLVRGRDLNLEVTESEELDMAIASKYRDGRLHPAASLGPLKTNALQQQHMRRLVGRLVNVILPESVTSSAAVLVLVREILACAVLQPVLQTLSDPDVLNQMIEAYGRTVIHERKTVRKLRAALDEYATPAPKRQRSGMFPQLSATDSERTFEKFIRAIRSCNNLSDARRFRSEVLRQINKDSAITGQDPTYLRRLEIGRKLLEQRVADLSSASPTRPSTSRTDSGASQGPPQAARSAATLKHLLYDASGLSYFMEYMDRLGLITLVQFWIVVDGMHSPLDHNPVGRASPPLESRSWTKADRQDIMQISQAYMTETELKVSPSVQQAVRAFLSAGSKATSDQFRSARQALLSVQDDVYVEMNEKHFATFKKSDLYYKWLSSETTTPNHANGAAPSNEAESADQWASPLHPRRETAQPALTRLRQPDLRRAIASSSHLPDMKRESSAVGQTRRSLDEGFGKRPLFDDDDELDPALANSTNSLGSDHDSMNDNSGDQAHIVAAVQAALDNIVEEKPDKNSSFDEQVAVPPDPVSPTSPRGSFDFPPYDGNVSTTVNSPSRVTSPGKDRPSLASLGLLGTPARPTVFTKDDLFGENEKLWEEADEQTDASGKIEDEVREAAPGDLGLAELVQSLSVEIDKLEAQQQILETLTRKAELTNNAAELRILRKSKTSLDREIRRKELQKQQYVVQEADNNLYGRATISIKSIMIGTEEDGHEFALYVIEIQRQAGEKSPAVTWAIARRYSEFHDLHKRLRAQYPAIRELDFPRRQMVLTLQKDFLRKRRAALEKYVRELLARPQICRSIEFRAFLSQQAIRPIASETTGRQNQIDRQDFITRIYNSVTDGMEEFLGNLPVLDQLSVAGQNLISAATAMPASSLNGASANTLSSSFVNDPRSAAEAEAEITALETRDPEAVSFIKPICDIFLELFQLNQGNNWLRGRALVVVVQQLLGGTIERKVRDSFKSLITEEALVRHLEMLRDMLWPQGKFRTSPPPRSPEEKARSRREAGLVLAMLLPDVAGGVVGRGNAAKAGRRIFATLNNERLNRHLIYTVVDEVVERIFGIRV